MATVRQGDQEENFEKLGEIISGTMKHIFGTNMLEPKEKLVSKLCLDIELSGKLLREYPRRNSNPCWRREGPLS
jgi:hypothetical protein